MKRFIVLSLFPFFVFSLFLNAQEEAVKQEILKSGVYAKRRAALMKKMDGGIAIFKGAEILRRNSDIDYPFRQTSNFHYLTGFDYPGAILLLIPGAKEQFIMFVEEQSIQRQMWMGKSEGVEAAKSVYGADAAFPVKEFDQKLVGFLGKKNKIYCSFMDEKLLNQITSVKRYRASSHNHQIQDPRPLVAELRLLKSKEEIALLQKAIDITIQAHMDVMRTIKPGLKEYQVAAKIHHTFHHNGSARNGFHSIVGSGPNASIMHYTPGSRKVLKGETILIDIGAEFGYYSADVTRTIPVSGKFSPRQKEIYNIVLKAQKAGINMAKPGKGIWEVFKTSLDIMTTELVSLGLITDPKKRWQKTIWFRYHQLGHWLGLDTHDVGSYRWEKESGRVLQPGMVFAFEPGIYIDPELLDNMLEMEELQGVSKEEVLDFVKAVKPIAEKYAYICIRIEDDILITKTGCKVLSDSLPRDVKSIEKLMR